MNPLRPCLLAACALAATFPTLTTSANFLEAQGYIDLDGSLVGYIDFEGDGEMIGTALNDIYQQVLTASPGMPPIPIDFNQLIETLGFGSFKASAFYYQGKTDLDPLLAAMDAMPQTANYKAVTQSALDFAMGGFFEPNMSVTTIEGGYWVTDQYAGYSTKQIITAIPAMIGGGIGAAMAIPAFQKVRETSQEKAVQNNLRQIAAAAQQYFIENDVTEVHIDQLTGENGYIRPLTPVAGENYEDMTLRQGEPIRVTLEDGSVITQEL